MVTAKIDGYHIIFFRSYAVEVEVGGIWAVFAHTKYPQLKRTAIVLTWSISILVWSDGVVIRLRNERDPERMVCVTNWTWVSILDIAEQHGWHPLGAMQPDWLWGSGNLLYPPDGQDLFSNNFNYESGRLVMLDDALNLADALERAFLAYEPERVRSYTDLTLVGVFGSAIYGKPGIGVILELAAFCQSGAFWIERY